MGNKKILTSKRLSLPPTPSGVVRNRRIRHKATSYLVIILTVSELAVSYKHIVLVGYLVIMERNLVIEEWL